MIAASITKQLQKANLHFYGCFARLRSTPLPFVPGAIVALKVLRVVCCVQVLQALL